MGFREEVQPFVFLKGLPSLIASLRHYIALYQGNIVPLPGTKRYVGRENPHSLFYSSPFTKSSETPINTGVPRGEELAQLFTTLHPPFTWIFYFPSGVCLPPGVPADLQSAVKKCSTYETGGFAIPPQSINS